MRALRTCSRCGVVVKEYATGGLCPHCLLRGGLGEAGALSDGQAQGPAALAGRRLGDYELLEEIAHGGMGVVYKARQCSLDRVVAVKLLLAGQFAEPKFIQRFRAEAEAVARLQHPNIVALHEIGEHEGYQYFSMDYVEGKNLSQVRQEFGTAGVDFRRCCLWVKTMAEAVHYAHQQGIIHRDLKPANVIIDVHDQPHITDFGLAKRLSETTGHEPTTADLTLTGQVLGSPNYLPPEQAAGKPAGPASDVYSLGAILYHLLTGRPPFEAESLTGVLKQVLEAEPVAPRLLNPGIPRDLATICQKCLEKEIPRRYTAALELAEELGRFLDGEPIRARPVGSVGRAWKWCQRQPVRAGLTGALALVFVLGITGIASQWRRAERERDLAMRHAYASDMKLVQVALEQGDLGGARRLLSKYGPNGEGAADLRGWEWRYLSGLCRSEEQSKLTQGTNGFVNLAMSPDGRVLALRHPSGTVDLWDWRVGVHLGTLKNQGWPQAMAFSPDGRFLASANTSGSGKPVVSFWDVAAQKIARDLPQPFGVASLAFSSDGRLLATVHTEPVCSVWHLPSGELLTNYTTGAALNADMRTPLFTPDGTKLVLGDWDSTGNVIRCIDLGTGSVWEKPASTQGNCITALALSPDGKVLASGYGYSDAIIDLWEVTTGAWAARLDGHRGWVKKLVFSPDGETLYSASEDQSIRAWNVRQRREIQRWRGHTGGLIGLARSPDGKTLVSCAHDGSARIWDAQGPRRNPAYVALPSRVGPYGAPFTADGRRVITASASDPVIVWEVASGRELERIPALGTNLLSLALSADDRCLATGSKDGWIQVWDMQKRALIARFKGSSATNEIYGIRWLTRDKSLLTLALKLHQECELKRWEAGSWREIPAGPTDVKLCQGFAQSPDGRRLAVADGLASTKVWDLVSSRLEAVLGAPGGWVPAFSANGRLLATPEGRARIWDLGSGREVATFEQPANNVISVAFSPDGKRLATGSRFGGSLQPALEIWDYVAQRGLLSLRSQGKFTTWMEFSPDGDTLLTLSWDGVAELWHAPSRAEIEAGENGK